METYRFSVDRENENDLPTAVMLSHVYELKGVKFAIRAAAVCIILSLLYSISLTLSLSLSKSLANPHMDTQQTGNCERIWIEFLQTLDLRLLEQRSSLRL